MSDKIIEINPTVNKIQATIIAEDSYSKSDFVLLQGGVNNILSKSHSMEIITEILKDEYVIMLEEYSEYKTVAKRIVEALIKIKD